MVHKFCNNHLTELYELIKAGDVSAIEKLEHEMSKVEECVACTYALRAKGEVRNTLVVYLKSEGFSLEAEKSRNIVDYIWFWIARFAVSGGTFLAVYVVARIYIALNLSILVALCLAIVAFILVDKVLS